MAKTIVGVFDDSASAQSVVRELQDAGIPQNHIRLTSNTEASAASESDKSWKDRVVHFFESLFEDESDRTHASNYAEAWRRGHYLVIADVDSAQVDSVVTIMNRFGTVDIDRRAEHWRSTGYTGTYDRQANPYTTEERARELASYKAQETQAIPVVQEELAVGKQVVRRGGVRIHSYVQERPVEEVIRLREERVNVQRRPVDRPADESEKAFQERTIDVVAQGEEAVVEKRAKVVEEVMVGKEVTQQDQTIRDTVRRKDVDVQPVESTKTAATTAKTPAKPTTPQAPSPRR